MALPDERTRLIHSVQNLDEEARSIVLSNITKDELVLGSTAVGERLPYNDYSSIDFLHDLIKATYRHRSIHSRTGIRNRLASVFDASSGWIVVTVTGVLMAIVASAVDITEATVSDLKFGYCSTNILLTHDMCCRKASGSTVEGMLDCREFRPWSSTSAGQFGVYIGWALLFGFISASITMLSKQSLPAAAPGKGDKLILESDENAIPQYGEGKSSKSIYMSAGAGIPEIKTILSGFVIPHFLDLRVMVLKALGAVFAVASGMDLGKEAPFIHISACLGNIVAERFPKFRGNGRQLREILIAVTSSGLSVAFGAPIGGVLFAYEELSCYFPRKVLWRSFLCSMVAAMTLKALNPNGTGKLVLFETNYGSSYKPIHYLIFVLIGVAGGVWGGTFTKLNYNWARWFRKYNLIRNHPVFEVCVIVLVTALLQYPNQLTRGRGDLIIGNLLVDCSQPKAAGSYICESEANFDPAYIALLVYGTLALLVCTTITLGVKVPAGVIMPALEAGALFGRLIGQGLTSSISPGVFAMVGAAAFLAGVARMTISLCIIMVELTGDIEYVLPHMIAILTAKWTADLVSKENIYDLTQAVLGHPFLDPNEAVELVQEHSAALVGALIPPKSTMNELTVTVPQSNKVSRRILETKLDILKRRGLMDSGLVLVQGNQVLQGYIPQNELDFGLHVVGQHYPEDCDVRLLGSPVEDGDLDLSHFVNRAPITISASAPIEVAVVIFTQLGVRYLCITEEGTGKLTGLVIKKRLMNYLDSLKTH